MAGTPSDDMEHHPSSSTVSITVLSVEPVKFGRIFALASVEVDIDGVPIVIHGVRAIRVHPIGTWIDLPRFRDENGAWRNAITLSDEISGPIGRAVPDEFVERGLAVREVRRFERRSPSSVLKAQNLLWESRLACATALVSPIYCEDVEDFHARLCANERQPLSRRAVGVELAIRAASVGGSDNRSVVRGGLRDRRRRSRDSGQRQQAGKNPRFQHFAPQIAHAFACSPRHLLSVNRWVQTKRFRRSLDADPSRVTATLPLRGYQHSTGRSPDANARCPSNRPARSPPARSLKDNCGRPAQSGPRRILHRLRSANVKITAAVVPVRSAPSEIETLDPRGAARR